MKRTLSQLLAVLAVGAGLFLVQPAALGQADYFKGPVATATSTAAAATINSESGTVTTESLSTAAQASYVFTLTDNVITTKSVILVNTDNGTNAVAGSNLSLGIVTPAAGSAVIKFTNTGNAALSGTMKFRFVVITK